MSVWTEVLLTMSLCEDVGTSECPIWRGVDHVNRYLTQHPMHYGTLFEVARPDNQCCPSGVFAGEFKSLNVAYFIEAVSDAPWEEPEAVRLYIRHEHDEPRAYTLRPLRFAQDDSSLQTLAARVGEQPPREEIARIISPSAFDRERALTKADAILELFRAARALTDKEPKPEPYNHSPHNRPGPYKPRGVG